MALVFEEVEGVKMVPGTIHLVDVEGIMDVAHGGDSDVVLVPQPTNDPNDPLTWSRLRKEWHYWFLWLWGFLAAVSVNWNGPVWTELEKDYNTSLTQLNLGSAFSFLFLGIGCVVLQPLAMKIGRRPVYILGSIFNILGNVIGGVSTHVEMFFGSNILCGFGAAPVDSLVQVTTTDIFFAHQKGTRLSIYVFSMMAGSFLGPVACGYIDESQGWQWCFWYLTIFFGALLVLQLFTLEESLFSRPAQASDVDGAGVLMGLEPDYEAGKTAGIVKASSLAETAAVQEPPPPPKTYLQHLALWDTRHADPRPLWFILLSPLATITFPAVVYGGFLYGVSIMWLSLTTTTQSEIFGAEPYNMSVTSVGLTNFASLVGSLLGMLWGGNFADWFTVLLTRRNRGIMEPEFRLWTLIVPAVINTGGLFMYGLGAEYKTHWVLPAVFGQALIGFGIASSGAIAITYAVDCYPQLSSEALVLMLFARNVIGFAFTFAIQPWLDASGLQNTTIAMAVICLAANLMFLIFMWKGKEIRAWTAPRYLRLAERKSGWGKTHS